MHTTNYNIKQDPLAQEIDQFCQLPNDMNTQTSTVQELTKNDANSNFSINHTNNPCVSHNDDNKYNQSQHMTHFVRCAVCGKLYSIKAMACPECAEPNKLKVCQDCGAQCSRRAAACPKCGAPFEINATSKEDANKNNNVVNVVVGNSAAAAGSQGVITGNAVAAATPYGAFSATTQSYATTASQLSTPQQTNYYHKWTAFVLCLFLGVFGAHRFYENKFPSGILYFFTFGLFGIGVIIDLVIILCKDEYYRA